MPSFGSAKKPWFRHAFNWAMVKLWGQVKTWLSWYWVCKNICITSLLDCPYDSPVLSRDGTRSSLSLIFKQALLLILFYERDSDIIDLIKFYLFSLKFVQNLSWITIILNLTNTLQKQGSHPPVLPLAFKKRTNIKLRDKLGI